MGQERSREASINKSLVAGWGTSHELAALHNMPHDSELFQNILTGLPFNMDWDEEDHLTLLFDTRAFAEGRTAPDVLYDFVLRWVTQKEFVCFARHGTTQCQRHQDPFERELKKQGVKRYQITKRLLDKANPKM